MLTLTLGLVVCQIIGLSADGDPALQPLIRHGFAYIGRGYNLVYGNPNLIKPGDEFVGSLSDPGLMLNFVLDGDWNSVQEGGSNLDNRCVVFL